MSIAGDKHIYKILLANVLSSIGTGITMIAIPWLLIQKHNGDQIFGFAMMGIMVAMMLLSPSIGLLIDQVSRKRLLIAGEIGGFLIVATIICILLLGYELQSWHLIILYASGFLYYALFYPSMFAFNQEIFSKSKYKSLNGMMEIQGQLSSLIAGGTASLLLDKVDFVWILTADAITFLLALVIFITIPYERQIREVVQQSFWRKLTEGFTHMKKKPLLFLFFFASFMPFVGIQVTNFLFPLFIQDILVASGLVYGLHEMLYAVGAILAGLSVPILMKRLTSYSAIIMTVILFTIGVVGTLLLPIVPIFLLLSIFLGLGNAGTRVIRNTMMMELVPNDKIGRVSSLFQLLGLGMRLLLIGSFTQVLVYSSVTIPIAVLGIIMVVVTVLLIGAIRRLKIQETTSNVSAVST